MATIFRMLGQQLKRARIGRAMSQAELARRVGRSVSRVSELERDLNNERWGRDRLTLFAEICDTLDLEPVLVPRARVGEVEKLLALSSLPPGGLRPVTAPFDDLFVDLGDEDRD